MNHSGNKPVLRLALCLGLVLAMPAFAKETGALRQAADLMAAPYSDAKVLGRVAENTRVEILERRGAWLHINAASKKGWVKLHQVRAGEGPEKKIWAGPDGAEKRRPDRTLGLHGHRRHHRHPRALGRGA